MVLTVGLEVAKKKGDDLDGVGLEVAEKQEAELESAGQEVAGEQHGKLESVGLKDAELDSAGLELIKNKDAELKRSVDSQTADITMRGYVDDGLSGGDEHVEMKLIEGELFDSETWNLKEARAGGLSHAPLLNLLQSLSLPKPMYTGTFAMVTKDQELSSYLGTLVRTRSTPPWM